jgi:hypothetical protein
MPTFPSYFGIEGDAADIARIKGDVVSLLQAGCCVGALLVNFLAGKNKNYLFNYFKLLMSL